MIQEWNYKGNADIDFGDIYISPIPKIIALSTFVSSIILFILAIIFRKSLIDLISNPQVILSDNTINVEVYSEFDPNQLIIENNELLTKIDTSNLNTNELGSFEVIYSSQNSIRNLDQIVTVNVVDSTAPVILLKTEENSDLNIKLEDGNYTTQVILNDPILTDFNPSNYIDLISDNYDDIEDILLDWPRKLDFTKVGTVTVVYGATDTSGNLGNTTLTINIVEQTDIDKIEYEEKITQMEQELSILLQSMDE